MTAGVGNFLRLRSFASLRMTRVMMADEIWLKLQLRWRMASEGRPYVLMAALRFISQLPIT